ncbi:MAG: hypothetical protein NT029_17910 [Armatimonadetes bacterium]|nr:hypothetical protein [Armatimonadota bacterium]
MTDESQPTAGAPGAEAPGKQTQGTAAVQPGATITPFAPPVRKAGPILPTALACLVIGCVIGFAAHMLLVPAPGRAGQGQNGARRPGARGQRLGPQDTLAGAAPGARIGAAVLAHKPGIALGRLVMLLSVFQQAQGMGLTDAQLARVRDIIGDLDMASELKPEEAGRRVRALAEVLTPAQKAAIARLMPGRGRSSEVETRPFLTARNIIALDYIMGRKPRQIREEEPATLEQGLSGMGGAPVDRSGMAGATQDR